MPGFITWLETSAGRVPQVSSRLQFADHLGTWKVRWGIGRTTYLIPPGLYAIGRPDSESPVVVTANYKMSYDLVRNSLAGRDVWLLILETFGINVWCAAGKGTFGTNELVRRLQLTGLGKVVHHRTLLLPILGAPGVAAHEVARQTGFRIRYAALRAKELPTYLDNGMNTTPAMRQLTFTLRERLALIPVDLVFSVRAQLPIFALLFIAGWLAGNLTTGMAAVVALLGAVIAGTAMTPLLLPWLPGASFAGKGLLTGLIWSGLWFLTAGRNLGWIAAGGTVLALTAISAFYALKFTGSTPFTSPSGVRKEIRIALPMMAAALFGAAVLWGWALFA